MSWSWAPQNIGKVSPGDPACLWAMLGFWLLAGGPLFGAMSKDLCSAIGAFGDKAVSLAYQVGKAIFELLRGFFKHPLGKNLLNLLEYFTWFLDQVNGFFLSTKVFDNFSQSVTVTFLNGKGEPI